MAKILGKAGRYPNDQTQANHRKILVAGLAAYSVFGIIVGIAVGRQLPFEKLPSGMVVVSGALLVSASIGVGIYSAQKIDSFERVRRSMRKGADGETRIGQILSDFPERFCVINGIATPFGDLDHIVVGPTGVFIIDTKNWRGTVSSDGNGELLLNGKQTAKPTIRPIVSRTMDMKEKIQTLCGFELPYFQVVLAFTSAWVEAKWGTTGKALCVTDDGLYDLIVENTNGVKLNAHEIDSVVRAIEVLMNTNIGISY